MTIISKASFKTGMKMFTAGSYEVRLRRYLWKSPNPRARYGTAVGHTRIRAADCSGQAGLTNVCHWGVFMVSWPRGLAFEARSLTCVGFPLRWLVQ